MSRSRAELQNLGVLLLYLGAQPIGVHLEDRYASAAGTELRLDGGCASLGNAVEGYFAKLAKRRIKRGVFHSLVALQAAINRFVAETNTDPRPFRWTKDPDAVIAAVWRGHQAVDRLD